MAVYNVRLTIEYDGAQFHGWQIQPGVRTVQSELERVLLLATRQQISKLRAAGRTDAGVHARGQVVNFTMPEPVDLRRLSLAVSGMLRPDLAVVAAEIEDGIHPADVANVEGCGGQGGEEEGEEEEVHSVGSSKIRPWPTEVSKITRGLTWGVTGKCAARSPVWGKTTV